MQYVPLQRGYSPVAVRLIKHLVPGVSSLKLYDLNFRPKLSGACLMYANAEWAWAGRCTVPG